MQALDRASSQVRVNARESTACEGVLFTRSTRDPDLLALPSSRVGLSSVASCRRAIRVGSAITRETYQRYSRVDREQRCTFGCPVLYITANAKLPKVSSFTKSVHMTLVWTSMLTMNVVLIHWISQHSGNNHEQAIGT